MSFLEVVGIASILPFMQLMSEPNAVMDHKYLRIIYKGLQFETPRSMLIASGVFVISLITISNIFAAFTSWLQYKYSWDAAHSLGTRLLTTYLKKPYSYFLNQNTSKLRAYLISEVGSLTGGVLIPTIELASRSIVCLVIFIMLMVVDIKISITMFLVLGGAYGLIYVMRQQRLKSLGEHRISSNMLRYKNLEELLVGIKTIRVYSAQKHFYERYWEASKAFCDVQPKVQLITATPRYLLEILAFGSILSVTLYLFITKGNLQSALPVLSLYAVAGYRLLPALQRAFAAAAKLKHSMPVLNKLYPDLKKSLAYADILIEEEAAPISFRQEILLDNISFHYESSDQQILSKINCVIPKGKIAAFVGSTGSGKTTLIDIIVGLLSPTKGQLLVDNQVIDEHHRSAWLQHLAYVPQEVFLYDDTVARNIVIGQKDEKIDIKRLHHAAQLANIHDFITNELSDGYDTAIGERGIRLSGGQRQRLGLARALYHNPSVLILDEATSALDNITEKEVIDSLKNIPKNITIIIIAHRLSTVRHADCIYLLNNGKIIEKGNYDHLLNKSEEFRTMVQFS